MNNINVGKCRGCQRKDLHKMCPAHGTLYYMSGEPFTKEVESIYDRFSLFINVKLMRKTYFFSQEAHKGQKRRNGKDYFLGHVLPVAMIASEYCIDSGAFLEDYITITTSALLHDVVEDTSITLQDIENYFGNNIACTVDALTRRKEENYYQFINRIRPEKYAPFVKLCDLLHNTNDVSLKDSNSNKHALYLFSIEKLSRDLSINILNLQNILNNISADALILDGIFQFIKNSNENLAY
jgi:(p)ppGpp synthase/HD superfamily hydrolase